MFPRNELLRRYILAWALSVTAQIQAGAADITQRFEAEVYDRAKIQFAEVDFFKPKEPKSAGLEFTLAPLILQEVNARQSGPRNRFGSINLSGKKTEFDGSHPSVYFASDAVRLNDKLHAQMAYLWCYTTGEKEKPGDDLALQGIRITAGLSGQPAIWEVMDDSSGLRLIFVSAALESKARAEFGEPLAGRHFAIERSWEAAPDVVVPRVVQDGPEPMGPIVYLSSQPRRVSTLICRCMPAQATNILETVYYDLVPFEQASQNLLSLKARKHTQTAFWPGVSQSNNLEASLRLPPDF